MGGKKRQTGTTCRAPTNQRRLACALARRGASVLADGFGPGTPRLPDTARRFLPPEGKFFHVRFWRACSGNAILPNGGAWLSFISRYPQPGTPLRRRRRLPPPFPEKDFLPQKPPKTGPPPLPQPALLHDPQWT